MATLVQRVNDLAVAIKNKFNLITPRLPPEGGTAGQVLTKTGPGEGDKIWADPTGGSLSEITSEGLLFGAREAEPSAAPSGKLNLHARSIANRIMPGWVGPAGVDTLVQPNLGMNKIISFSATGHTTNPGSVIGTGAISVSGTATSRTSTFAESVYARTRRIGAVSSAAAGSACGFKSPYAQATLGTGTGFGGFFIVIRFAISDAAPVSGARMFVGMDGSGSGASTADPSSRVNYLGIGHGSDDSNLMLYVAASTPASRQIIDLGADFPIGSALVNTDGDIYELILFSPPNELSTATLTLTRLNTGHTVTHSFDAGSLPAPAVGLNPLRIERSNNTTALAVGVDLASFYYETDY